MDKELTKLNRDIYDIVGYEDYKKGYIRKVVVTPIIGDYGNEAGFAIVVEGSPVKGAIVYLKPITIIVYSYKTRKVKVYDNRQRMKLIKAVKAVIEAEGYKTRL